MLATTTDGLRVFEEELTGNDPRALVAKAEEHDADVLWIHANADLTPFGFEKRDGYTRLYAGHTPPGEALPLLPASDYARVLAAAYHGMWGHKHVSLDATPPSGGTVVGVGRIGLCRVFPAERLIDGPGVQAGRRTVANYVRLLHGGCAALGSGPAHLDSWGDAPEVIAAYCELGFEIVEQTAGWELLLKAPPRSDRRPT